MRLHVSLRNGGIEQLIKDFHVGRVQELPDSWIGDLPKRHASAARESSRRRQIGAAGRCGRCEQITNTFALNNGCTSMENVECTGRFINHSWSQTAKRDGRRRIWLVATREIRTERRSTFNYGFDWTITGLHCHCGAPGCTLHSSGGILRSRSQAETIQKPSLMRSRKGTPALRHSIWTRTHKNAGDPLRWHPRKP